MNVISEYIMDGTRLNFSSHSESFGGFLACWVSLSPEQHYNALIARDVMFGLIAPIKSKLTPNRHSESKEKHHVTKRKWP